MLERDRYRGFDRQSQDAAHRRDEVPGKRTLSSSLPVQRIEVHPAPTTGDDRAAGSASALAAERARPRPTVQQLFGLPGVQRRIASDVRAADVAPERVRELASEGTAGAGGSLPHLEAIQRSFGRHDVGGIRAHTDEAAAASAGAMGAAAFATGNRVAFAGSPDLHTAAHEAAHVIQQRGGVQLQAHVGQAGDAHERHADEVADRVVQGDSAEALLDRYASGEAPSTAVQRVITTKAGTPYASFSRVKGQLTKDGIELSETQMDELEDIFDKVGLDLTLKEAVEQVQGGPSARKPPRKPKVGDQGGQRARKKKRRRDDDRSKESDDTEGSGQRAPKKKLKQKVKASTASAKAKDKTRDLDGSDAESRSEPEPESESDDGARQTIGEMVIKALDKLNITDRGLRCLLVEPAIETFAQFVKLAPESVDTIAEGSVDAPVQLGDDGLRPGWLAYTACYNTAVELVDMLRDGKQGALTGAKKADIATLSEKNAEKLLATTIGNLCQAIRDASRARRIFRIHYGIHGFAIAVRDGQAELLESFAGTSGHSFLKGLEDHPVYAIAGICQNLTDMVCDDERRSGAAQRTLFGGSVEDESNVWPKIELLWSQSQLMPDEQIVREFTRMFATRIRALKRGGQLGS